MPVLSNPKHERFAQELARGKSATEAMETVGYSDPRNSTRLTKNDEIRNRVAELLSRAADKTEVTVASILEELEDARQIARSIEQPAAAVSASMGKAKVLGLIVDRREVGNPGDFDAMTDEQLAENAARQAASLGLDATKH